MWIKDPLTRKKSITTTMLTLWTLLTASAFTLHLVRVVEGVTIVLVGGSMTALFAAMHFNKRVRISRSGIIFGGSDADETNNIPTGNLGSH